MVPRVILALVVVAVPLGRAAEIGRRFRVHGLGTYVVGVGLDMDGFGLVKDPVSATLQAWDDTWEQLKELAQDASAGDGAKEAALKLISNHEAVLRDVTAPGRSPTQPNLVRAGLFDASIVDHALREISTRLLGRTATDPSAEHAQVWATTARYLADRLQATHDEKMGRTPDMSVAAAVAMRDVLREIAELASREMQLAA